MRLTDVESQIPRVRANSTSAPANVLPFLLANLIQVMRVRKLIVTSTVAAVLLTAAGVTCFSAWVLTWPMPQTDRLAVIGDTLAGGAFLLVAVGVILALAAYLIASAKPDLNAEVVFAFSEPNQPVFVGDALPDGAMKLQPFKQVEGRVRIHNGNGNSARNPALRIDLVGLGGLKEQPPWVAVAFANQVGAYAIQWDGGADYSIHGNWTRELPPLSFEEVFALPGILERKLVLTVVAEGFKRVVGMPVRVLTAPDYEKYTQDRAAKYRRMGESSSSLEKTAELTSVTERQACSG